MTLEIDVRIDTDYMHVHAKGRRSRDGVFEIAHKILEICDEHHQSKILIDVREMKGRLGGLDSYSVASVDLPMLIRSRQLQVAIVDDDLPDESITFFEKFCQEQSFNLRVFGSIVDATTWLRE